MIQSQTHLNVADNSDALELMCIRIIGANNHRYAHIGDVIVAVIKEAVPNMPLQRSEVVRTVIIGAIAWELRDLNFTKTVSLAPKVL